MMKMIFKSVLILMAVLLMGACGDDSSSDQEGGGNHKPVIGQIGHTLVRWREGFLPSTVWAQVSDEDGLSDIKSVVAVQTVKGETEKLTFTLYDDGNNSDEVPNDGRFEFSMADSGASRYYLAEGHLWTIIATDQSGAITTKTFSGID